MMKIKKLDKSKYSRNYFSGPFPRKIIFFRNTDKYYGQPYGVEELQMSRLKWRIKNE